MCARRGGNKQSSDCGHTHFDGPVTRGRHYVLIVKVHHVDSGPVADEHAAQSDVGGGGHVPHGDGAVLGAGHHQPFAEAQVEHSLVVVDQRVQNFTCVHIPDSRGQQSTVLRWETTRTRRQGLCSEPSVSVNSDSRLGSVGFTCTW